MSEFEEDYAHAEVVRYILRTDNFCFKAYQIADETSLSSPQVGNVVSSLYQQVDDQTSYEMPKDLYRRWNWGGKSTPYNYKRDIIIEDLKSAGLV